MTPAERAQCAEILRAVAGLVEAGDATGELDADVTFWVTRAGDQPAALRAIAEALPLRWSGASSTDSGGGDWYVLKAATEHSSSVRGIKVRVYAHADAVAVKTGTRTVTEWAPLPEVAALLGDDREVTP